MKLIKCGLAVVWDIIAIYLFFFFISKVIDLTWAMKPVWFSCATMFVCLIAGVLPIAFLVSLPWKLIFNEQDI